MGVRAIDLFDVESLKLKINNRLQIAIDQKDINQEDVNKLDFRDFYDACIKINKFISDNTLLNQEWIMDSKKKVKDVMSELSLSDLKINEFYRIKIGE